MRWVNEFFVYHSWLALGSPRHESEFEPTVSVYRSGASVQTLARRLLVEVKGFCGSGAALRGPACAGRAEVLQHLEKFEKLPYGSSNEWVLPSTNARPVVASRVAMPSRAGSVDTLKHLPPEYRTVVQDLSKLVLPEDRWPNPLPRSCHLIDQAEEVKLTRLLLEREMGVLLPESSLPRGPKGQLVLGGFFVVPKDSEHDRLIYDRRMGNATCKRLHWLHLPSAASLKKMKLKPGEVLAGSGEDLKNYYYILGVPSNAHHLNPVGRRVSPKILKEAGLDPKIPHRLCLRVLGMGDQNSCDIAQAAHETLLPENAPGDDHSELTNRPFGPRVLDFSLLGDYP